MNWIEDTVERRSRPDILWPEARSIIMLAMNYGPDSDPCTLQTLPSQGTISVYARHRDYHDLIKGRLKQIASRFSARTGNPVKVFVDTSSCDGKTAGRRRRPRLAGQAYQPF
ncbi:MAG: epoxyqueuosine reductase [Candidatus Tokpelaia sp. JSC189]|nr:MAG: epoxyqueuosine reductase [Candidatus Tokpelaia sp. JSC189]